MEIKVPEMVILYSEIDWKLLARQKKNLVELRSKTPSASKNYELFTGLIHLLDGLTDAHLDTIGNIVLFRDYSMLKQYFAASIYDCRSDYDDLAYEMVISRRKTYKYDFSIAYPSSKFSPNDWANFHRYGLNNPFELS